MKGPWKFEIKVNSVQEAYTKCFAVHILELENLANHIKKWNDEHQTLSIQFFINWNSILMFFVLILMGFVRFQILVCEPQTIWLFAPFWLYIYWNSEDFKLMLLHAVVIFCLINLTILILFKFCLTCCEPNSK